MGPRKQKWLADFSAASKTGTGRWWQAMYLGRKRYHERLTLNKEARRSVVLAEWKKLKGAPIPLGWQVKIAKRFGVGRWCITWDLQALGLDTYTVARKKAKGEEGV